MVRLGNPAPTHASTEVNASFAFPEHIDSERALLHPLVFLYFIIHITTLTDSLTNLSE